MRHPPPPARRPPSAERWVPQGLGSPRWAYAVLSGLYNAVAVIYVEAHPTMKTCVLVSGELQVVTFVLWDPVRNDIDSGYMSK